MNQNLLAIASVWVLLRLNFADAATGNWTPTDLGYTPNPQTAATRYYRAVAYADAITIQESAGVLGPWQESWRSWFTNANGQLWQMSAGLTNSP